MKFSLKTTAIVLGIFVVACAAMLFLVPAEAQEKKTQPQWTVVFTLKQGNVPGPDARFYILVNATLEGEAAIAGHKYLCEKLTTNAQENLIYLECQRKQ